MKKNLSARFSEVKISNFLLMVFQRKKKFSENFFIQVFQSSMQLSEDLKENLFSFPNSYFLSLHNHKQENTNEN